jgi:ribose 5-phosphate isomerase B
VLGISLAGRRKLVQLSKVMKIAIASDHAGFAYKEQIKALLNTLGHEVSDFGTSSDTPVDYPLFIRPAAEAVARGECERGIVLGGSGNGEAIVANKVRGIRCALCWSLDIARWSREHNDANVLAIGQRTISVALALEIVGVWLTTPFDGGRHAVRVRQIEH